MSGTGEGVHLWGKSRFLRTNALPVVAGIAGQRAISPKIKAPLLRGALLLKLQLSAKEITKNRNDVY